jgi:CheY-like chemotaxis protein
VGAALDGVILVVDDEPVVRRVIARVAGSVLGEVDEAADGPSGLARLLAGGDRYRLAVIDQTLPGLDGIGVIEAARAAGVRVPFLLVSGAPLDAVLKRRLDSAEPWSFMTKPFPPAQLVAAMHRLLDSESR